MTAPVFCPGPSLFRDCRRAIVAGIGFEEREHSARPTRGAQAASCALWQLGTRACGLRSPEWEHEQL